MKNKNRNNKNKRVDRMCIDIAKRRQTVRACNGKLWFVRLWCRSLIAATTMGKNQFSPIKYVRSRVFWVFASFFCRWPTACFFILAFFVVVCSFSSSVRCFCSQRLTNDKNQKRSERWLTEAATTTTMNRCRDLWITIKHTAVTN